MKRLALLALLVWPAASQPERLRLMSRIPIGEVQQGKLVRAWLCGDDLVFVTNREGELIAVDTARESVLYRKTFPELMGLGGCTCDDRGFVYFSLHRPEGAFVRIYSLGSQGALNFERSFRITGRLDRLLVAGNQLYGVGLARIGSDYVFLRRFLLPEGLYLGSPETGVPMRVGGEPINRFAVDGTLFWHPGRKQVVYLPANPFELWRLDLNGKAVGVERPPVTDFIAAPPGTSGNRDFLTFDRVDNAAALPDGRIVVLVVFGTRRPGGGSFLAVLDADLRPTGIQIPLAPEMNYLLGASSDGTLYFADLVVPAVGTSSIVKSRLTF